MTIGLSMHRWKPANFLYDGKKSVTDLGKSDEWMENEKNKGFFGLVDIENRWYVLT